jgi:hypothetical protein
LKFYRLTPLLLIAAVLVALFVMVARRNAPRDKVVNPMIDSADKFEPVYTETLARSPTAIEQLLGEQPPQPSRPHRLPVESARVKPGPPLETTVPAVPSKTAVKADRDSALIVPPTERPFEVVGTVRRVELEGGFWGITSDKGENYDPVNLPESLKQDGLKVHFWLRPRKGMATTRMWGTPAVVVRYAIKTK